MRRIPIAVAKPGHTLAEPVVNQRGLMAVRAGTTLTEAMIDRLRDLGVWHIFIDEPGYEGIEVLEPLSVRTLYPLVAYLRSLVRQVAAAERVQDLHIEAAVVMDWASTVVDEVGMLGRAPLLYWPQGEEDRWIGRTINMAVLAARTLRHIGGIRHAHHVVAAALLQDLGVWRLTASCRESLYRERSPQAIRKHVAASESIVDQMEGVSPVVKAIVSQHHERWDGSGYPRGRGGEAIHPLAGIMAVVDEYLATVFDGPELLVPHEAIERLMAAASFDLSHAAVKAFCAAAPVYPVGLEVQLATGERGVIAGASSLSSRPIVRVLTAADGRPTVPREVNLAESPTHMIVRVIH